MNVMMKRARDIELVLYPAQPAEKAAPPVDREELACAWWLQRLSALLKECSG